MGFGEIVVVDHEFEVSVDGAVDKSNSVTLSFGKMLNGIRITVNVGAVDETVVQGWRPEVSAER